MFLPWRISTIVEYDEGLLKRIDCEPAVFDKQNIIEQKMLTYIRIYKRQRL